MIHFNIQEPLYSLINQLKEIGTVTFDDSSKELHVTTDKYTFTVVVQMEHSSFLLLTDKVLAVETYKKRNMIQDAVGLHPIAAYQYTNNPDTMVTQWCYDEEKVLDTIEYLKQLENSNQIENLQYSSNFVLKSEESKGRNV